MVKIIQILVRSWTDFCLNMYIVQGEKSVLSLKALITRFRFHHSENFPFFSTVKIRTSSTVTSAEGRSGAVLVE